MDVAALEQFVMGWGPSIDVGSLAAALVLAAALSYVLGVVYIKYGTSLSNRRKFANNFVLLATTTTLIITVVRSSLALSLGLVGALSIVRFRAAIKEPEELGFLFFTIAIGLGLGASQFVITIVSFVIISTLIVVKSFMGTEKGYQNLCLTVSAEGSKASLKAITSVLSRHCPSVSLRRFDSAKGVAEASFFVSLPSPDKLDKIKTDLEKLSKSVRVTYVEAD
ncbi:DUF4956 domain-containing protein [archaeon]